MNRYKILLGEKPKEIKLKKPKIKDVPRNVRNAFFTDAKVMIDYMTEIGGKWFPESNLYFEEIPLIGYKSTDEIALIGIEDYHLTKKSLPKTVLQKMEKENILYFRKSFI